MTEIANGSIRLVAASCLACVMYATPALAVDDWDPLDSAYLWRGRNHGQAGGAGARDRFQFRHAMHDAGAVDAR